VAAAAGTAGAEEGETAGFGFGEANDDGRGDAVGRGDTVGPGDAVGSGDGAGAATVVAAKHSSSAIALRMWR
jgi:hypothetical protein